MKTPLFVGRYYVITSRLSARRDYAPFVGRYYVILHPMKAQYICTRSQANRTVAAIWVLSFILSCPMLVAQVSGYWLP